MIYVLFKRICEQVSVYVCAFHLFIVLSSIIKKTKAVSLKSFGGKMAPKLVHFVLIKELLNCNERSPKNVKC